MRKYLLLITLMLTLILTGCFWRDDLTIQIIPGVDTVTVGQKWNDPGCETNGDECVLYDGTVNTDKPGEYEVYYKATVRKDELYAKRVVTVVDDIKPVVSLNAGVDSILLGTTWIDAGCNVSDNYDESPTCKIIKNNVDLTKVGTYEIVYEAKDSSNNKSYITRYVSVINP